MRTLSYYLALSLSASATFAASINDCPGYAASNIVTSSSGLNADLSLNGNACNAYGQDLTDLRLTVEYQTASRIHVKIEDKQQVVYQVPASVLPRPEIGAASNESAAITFSYVAKPFSFAIQRAGSSETIFNTSGSNLIFESQYLRLRTSLPQNPNLYGLGEHTDPFRLNTTDYTRTLWSRDAYEIPPGTNLYGNHPVYFEHRAGQTHGVFLLNSNGMDVKINNTAVDGQYLEYNTLGGIIDLYFLAGPGPIDVAKQYSEVVGKAAMMPYWGFGFHQCKYGYQDYQTIAEVVENYTLANVPLETMWTDIDYMDARKVFTLDPLRFPLERVRELVSHLHANNQHYVVMVDPAVADQDYPAFNSGVQQGIFLKEDNGSIYRGVVWPGVTAFPDWFNPNTQNYWNNEFDTFFSADNGVDIDALWIDMNEASNFCLFPCLDPVGFAAQNGFPPVPPPVRTTWPALPGWPADFQPPGSSRLARRQNGNGNMIGLPGRDLVFPPYMINNAAGVLSDHTINTTLVHSGGYVEYDVHNLYGTMMSAASRNAMLSRRPTVRPLVITRSTFAGAGAQVGHWLGDNSATWHDYRISISGMLQFAGIYQIPMVGSDVCGYAQNTTETLCARWAMLGAFYPFYRNHAASDVISHEFYRWASVTQAAQTAIDARYRLLDYLYTSIYQQTLDGTPLISPLWYLYPTDSQTFGIDLQFFFGLNVLVSPVTMENEITVDIYLPDDQFYDFFTYAPVRGHGSTITLSDVGFESIPVHIRGGSILPLRIESANTTTALRTKDFNVVVAPGLQGAAQGSLYLDDGNSLVQNSTSQITFSYTDATTKGASPNITNVDSQGNSSSVSFTMDGKFGYDMGSVKVAQVVILGWTAQPKGVQANGRDIGENNYEYNATASTLTVKVGASLMQKFNMNIST